MRKLFALAAGLLPFALYPRFLAAQTPQLINYQGRLLSGTNLVNGSVGLLLRLFDAASLGTLLYEDSNSVTIADGLYSTFIGDNTTSGTLTNALSASNVWIEVAVDGVALSPRERLVSVAYAIGAQSAQEVAANAITASMIATGAVQGFHLAAGAVTTASLADGAVSGTKIASNTITTANVADGGLLAQDFATVGRLAQPLFITNPTPAVRDFFGYHLAGVGSNRVAVGAFVDDASGVPAGSVYLCDLNGSLLMTITNPAPEAIDLFGSSVAGIGSNRFVVGAEEDDAGAINAGSVYLYDFDGNLLATITNPAPAPPDEVGAGESFGRAVAAVGLSRFVVGAHRDDVGAENAGSAYLYDLNGVLLATISNPAPATGDFFGYALAGIGSNRFVVGKPYGNSRAGSAYLYDFDGNLLAILQNPTPAMDDRFGFSIAGAGPNRFVVGAFFDDASAVNSGIAYLYDLNGNLLTTITNPAPSDWDDFGFSVSGVGSNRFLVGAVLDDPGATDAGIAYLYDLNGRLLATITNPAPAAGDNFGYTVSAVGLTHFVVGARGDDAGAADAGSVYLYDLASLVPVVTGLVAESVAPNAVGIGQLDTASVDERYVVKMGTAFSRIQDGVFVAGPNGTSFKVVTNAFPVAFNTVPNVVATAVNDPAFPGVSDTFAVTVSATSTTNFTVNIKRVDDPNGLWGQDLRISWHAWE